MDAIPVYGRERDVMFSGRRKKRGLYVSADGMEIKADVNATGNIMRKAYPYAFDGFDLSLLSVTVECVTSLYPQRRTAEPVSGRKHKNHKSPGAFERHEEHKCTKRMYEELFPPVRRKKKPPETWRCRVAS